MELFLLNKKQLQTIVQLRGLQQLLSQKELHLYADLLSIQRKEEWLAGRIATKSLLNRWLVAQGSLQILETEIEISNDGDGRPYVTFKGLDAQVKRLLEDIDISISHHGNYALSGLTVGNRIGIDVSTVRPINEAMRAYFLSDEELQRNETFLAEETGPITCWAIKEAYLKALGKGFTVPPKSFQVFFGSDDKVTIEDSSRAESVRSIYFNRTKDIIISAVVIQK